MYPPLVDLEHFTAAQRPVPRPGRRGDRAPALLAGLVRCAGCGHSMSRGSAKVMSYGCPRQHSGVDCPAPAAVTLALLDQYVERLALAELSRLSVTATEGDGVEIARARMEAAERELSTYVEAVSAASIGAAAFAAGARARSDQLDAARAELQAELTRQPGVPVRGTGADAWQQLDAQERNSLLRSLIHVVIVARAGGRGRVVPLETRVRVVKSGADLPLPKKRGGAPLGIVPLPLLDSDDPRVLRVPASQ
jgi:hypothetical protein